MGTLLWPAYRPELLPAFRAQRRQSLLGFVGIVVDVRRALQEALIGLPPWAVDVAVYDDPPECGAPLIAWEGSRIRSRPVYSGRPAGRCAGMASGDGGAAAPSGNGLDNCLFGQAILTASQCLFAAMGGVGSRVVDDTFAAAYVALSNRAVKVDAAGCPAQRCRSP